MSEVSEFLAKSGVQYFATVGLDGNPKVRPFQMMFEEGGKLFYCTSNKKEVYKEIQARPSVEICASGEGNSWLRLSGRVIFTDDLAIKAKILKVSPLVNSIYKSPDNPVFEAFWIDDAKAIIADFSGKPPKRYTLG